MHGAHRSAAIVVLVAAASSAAGAGVPATDWNFSVMLDGKPIGQHRYAIETIDADTQRLSSEARFDVKLLGLSLYRYRHRADERWSGGCLASIEAQTDDNGRVTEVRGRSQARRFEVDARGPGPSAMSTQRSEGCLMSFAYWNPALANQTRLLDPGSGRVESVVIATVPEAPADLQRQAAAPLRGLRIQGLAQPIDVWYAGDRWVGLDTVVDGGRHLSYRLR